jgi:hypothetical protein
LICPCIEPAKNELIQGGKHEMDILSFPAVTIPMRVWGSYMQGVR